jgi:RND family efflux transporter MFP subunit
MAVRTYTSTLLEALANAVPSGTFDAAAIASAQTSVGTLNTTISSLIISLQNAQQQIASAKLAVQSAQDALAKINAGSTSQTIEAQQAAVNAAQAQVENLAAQINDALIIAPFSGTVASVNVKTGQTVSADAVAMSLTPQSALQVELQVSELDIAKLTVGDSASVTLDAYGSSHIFPATVVSIDRAPTVINGVSSYKVVLQFADDDSSIATGMTANATIVAAQKQNVLTIQKSAVLHSGADTFVLVPSSSGPIQQKIQTGVESDTQVEVTSGLSAGSEYLVNAQ